MMNRHSAAGYPFDFPNYLEVGRARSRSQVQSLCPVRSTIQKIRQRGNMRRSQVGHMDVIPLARAIPGGVIGPKKLERLVLPVCRDESPRNQMRLRIVRFADLAIRVCTARVEIT